MTLTVQPVRLGNVYDTEGALVYDGDALIAVLCQLSAEHGDRAGRWFLECGFGGMEWREDFPSIDAARAWIADWLARPKA